LLSRLFVSSAPLLFVDKNPYYPFKYIATI